MAPAGKAGDSLSAYVHHVVLLNTSAVATDHGEDASEEKVMVAALSVVYFLSFRFIGRDQQTVTCKQHI